MELTPLTYAGSSLVALVVGFLTGIFGIGGGFLMTPSLIVLLGIPPNIAVGTDLAAILINSSYGIFKRRGTGTVDVKLALIIAVGSIFGILSGLCIMEHLKAMEPVHAFGKEHSAAQYVLLCLFLPLLLLIALFLTFDVHINKREKPLKRTGFFSGIKLPPYVHFNSLDEPRLPLLPVIGMGAVIGVPTALMGIGGGVILLPALIFLIGQRTVKAVGTSLLLVWISSATAAAGHALKGNIEMSLLAVMVISGLVGTNLGTYVGLKLPGAKIRSYFIYIVALAIVMVAFKLLRLTFC